MFSLINWNQRKAIASTTYREHFESKDTQKWCEYHQWKDNHPTEYFQNVQYWVRILVKHKPQSDYTNHEAVVQLESVAQLQKQFRCKTLGW